MVYLNIHKISKLFLILKVIFRQLVLECYNHALFLLSACYRRSELEGGKTPCYTNLYRVEILAITLLRKWNFSHTFFSSFAEGIKETRITTT